MIQLFERFFESLRFFLRFFFFFYVCLSRCPNFRDKIFIVLYYFSYKNIFGLFRLPEFFFF